MPNREISTNSLIKMKLLTWFSGYTLVNRTETPIPGPSGSTKYATEWRLTKPEDATPESPAPETGEGPPAQADAAAEDHGDHVCPVNPEVHHAGPGKCPKCGAPLRVAEADPEPS